jgi:DmsE family decaheme c-type cytochrome
MRRSLWTIPLSVLALGLLALTATADTKAGATSVLRAPGSPPATAQAGPFDASDCVSCHESSLAKLKQTKHAGIEGGCVACHDRAKSIQHSADQAEGKATPGPSVKSLKAAELTAVCTGCHEKGDQMNFAGSAHDRKDVSCVSCHAVHSFKSATGQLKTVRDADNCYSCHPQVRAKMNRNSHHPVREGKMECASCHNPHDGSKPKMLKAASVNDNCFSCHTEKRGPFLWEHAPVRENCSNCHDPHGSNHDKMLVAKSPFLCQRCHLNTRHPGTLYDGANSLTGVTVPAPGVPTVSSRSIEHACKNCHQTVHGSNHPSGPYLGR